jgi:FkbM family methyltransferase
MISYSQPATKQDLWVINRLEGKRNGVYVEIGAHDGLRHSNTKLLEDHFGWKGLLVEPQFDLYVECIRNRDPEQREERNQLAQWVVGRTTGEEVFFLRGNSYGGIQAFMPDGWKREHIRRGTKGDYRKTQSLKWVLHHHQMPGWIDYLSLDVEGAELPILEGYFSLDEREFVRKEFGIISIEFRYDDVFLARLEEQLSPHYTLEHVEAFDAFFVNTRLNKAPLSRAA